MSPNQIAFTLDSDFYISQEIYRKELEAIFYRSWQYACHKSQIAKPGDFFCVRVGTQEIFLVRGKDDLVRAFFNVCPHRAHPIVNGCGNRQMLVCPYHAWTFFLNGEFCRVRKTQALDGFDPAQFNLSEVRAEEMLGFYFINLDEKSPSLRSLSGRLESEMRETILETEQLVHAHHVASEVKANWKVLVDNHLDDHPLSPIHSHNQKKNTPAITHAIYSSHGEHAWWIWPNLFIVAQPERNSVAVIKIKITDEGHAREELDVFCLDEAEVEDRNLSIKHFRSKLNAENLSLCERVQVGLSSRAYQRGPLVIDHSGKGKSEQALVHFHTLVQDALSRLKTSSKTLRPTARDLNAPV